MTKKSILSETILHIEAELDFNSDTEKGGEDEWKFVVSVFTLMDMLFACIDSEALGEVVGDLATKQNRYIQTQINQPNIDFEFKINFMDHYL